MVQLHLVAFGPVAFGCIQSGFSHFFGPATQTLKHYLALGIDIVDVIEFYEVQAGIITVFFAFWAAL
jgi:hypothetical protein